MNDDPTAALVAAVLDWYDAHLLLRAARVVTRQGPGRELLAAENLAKDKMVRAIERHYEATGTEPPIIERINALGRGRTYTDR